MKIEPGIWMLVILAGIGALVALQRDKNRDSLHRFILLFAGGFLVISGILFLAKGWFGLNILQNNFMQPDIWLWIFVILIGIVALVVRRIDKPCRSFNASLHRFVLLVGGISSIIVGLWFLVARMFGYSYYNLIFGL